MRITRAEIQRRIDVIEKVWGFTDATGYAQVPARARDYKMKNINTPYNYREIENKAYMAYGERTALQALLYA